MLASPGACPSGEQWVWEYKWDGQRGVAVVDAQSDSVMLLSRNGNDITASYPDVVAALAASAGSRSMVVDGEIVALNGAGRPDFGLLQRRMHVKRPSAVLLRSTPATYFVFDVLYVDGESVRSLPYIERRDWLDGLKLADGRRVQVPPNVTGIDGETLMAIAAEHGIEGVVAKRADSIYRPGIRAKSWIKVPLRQTREGVICGWTDTASSAGGGSLGALLLGAYNTDGALTYIGSVGTGFTDRVRRALRTQLTGLSRPDSPLDDSVPQRETIGVSWVDPVIVAIVEYREQSSSGRLRHPAYKGTRTDMLPDDVRM